MSDLSLKGTVIVLAATLALTVPALADQQYVVNGNDLYQIAGRHLQTSVAYRGTEKLTIRKQGSRTRFVVLARYTRADADGNGPLQATFVQEMTPSGTFEDRTDLDPNELTVLNQPFAIELDSGVLRDLRQLRRKVAFDVPAPMTGNTLHGYLRRAGIGRVASRTALAVAFDAAGNVNMRMPGHAGISIGGTMRMTGTAYYAMNGAPLLLALRETLTISGMLQSGAQSLPLTIVSRRAITAAGEAADRVEADARSQDGGRHRQR